MNFASKRHVIGRRTKAYALTSREYEPSLYPSCTIVSHHPDSTTDAVATTKLNDSFDAKSRPSPIEYPATSGDSPASQGAEKKPNFVPAFPTPHFAESIGTVKIHEGDHSGRVHIPIPVEVFRHPTNPVRAIIGG